MENTNARLLQLKAHLFALLALLGAVLLFTGLFAYRQMEEKHKEMEQVPFCGTESLSAPLGPFAIAGKELFIANCAACHNKNMVDDLTGPALRGVEVRWAAYPRQDLYNWIRHSQQMVKANHPRATELWTKWKPTLMNDFSSLTDEQIEQILAYVASR
jgi:cytochrome c2